MQVRPLRPADGLLSADELTAAIGPRTRLAKVVLVVNASQAMGARPIDVQRTPVDAVVSCGYKWLCGPYATGFAWLHPALAARLRPQQAYWLTMQAGRGLDQMRQTTILGVEAFDVFCPASFATTLPWIASLELLLNLGIETIANWGSTASRPPSRQAGHQPVPRPISITHSMFCTLRRRS